MTSDTALGITQDMLLTAALVAAPVLGVALAVGLAISILQVVTQIQEMTLTFVPKIAAILAVMIIVGPWMLSVLTDFASELFRSIPELVR